MKGSPGPLLSSASKAITRRVVLLAHFYAGLAVPVDEEGFSRSENETESSGLPAIAIFHLFCRQLTAFENRHIEHSVPRLRIAH